LPPATHGDLGFDRVSPAQIEVFAGVCVAADRAGAARFIEHIRADGLDAESVFLDLIGPAARYLGQQWESDALSFSDVTVGLSLMHAIVHEMGYDHHDGPQLAGAVKRIMLACAPGSQHLLGLSMVSELFRRAGWQVVVEIAPSTGELSRAVKNEWFDMIGLSVALDVQLATLADLVATLKRSSRNPQTHVILGGPIFALRSCTAEDFGAQGICQDGRDSVLLATRLVSA
jgi:MerR family transcriptional regulator, light-induced transcriptional regulator